MRFELTLNRISKQRMLPMNYQYYISAWVYRVIRQADEEFADFLHERGYGDSDTKRYKLFCFDRLNFGKPTLWREKKLFEISSHIVKLQVSFDVQEIASNFIKGLFVDQEFYLGDKFNGIDFRVGEVKALEEPTFRETVEYRLNTPWVVSYQPDNEKHPRYLPTSDSRFRELALRHIAEKYRNSRVEESEQASVLNPKLDIEITSDSKRAGYLLKEGTPQETRIVGNIFKFKLTAPIAIHQMIWNSGISEKSSSGFGWVEIDARI